jgi:hypothetical protein
LHGIDRGVVLLSFIDFIHQQGGAVRHPSRATTRAPKVGAFRRKPRRLQLKATNFSSWQDSPEGAYSWRHAQFHTAFTGGGTGCLFAG